MSGNFVCPKCGSENIQKCSVIYRSGTVGHSYTTRSGDYTAETSGVESTDLAQSVAPPPKKEEPYGGMLGCFALAGLFLMWNWPIVAVICGLAGLGNIMSIKEALDYNNNQWPRDYRAWENSYLCHRCGHYFQLKD